MKRRLTTETDACYHVISRITERRYYFGRYEKEMFRNMMMRAAEFSGVEILTYCIMDNHFHILVRVPERREVSDEQLLWRIKCLYRGDALLAALAEYDWCRQHENGLLFEQMKARYVARMYDLSQFMKTLKQRFSIWYNRTHDRRGSLWEGDRFKSVLVEGEKRRDPGFGSRALLVMGGYIDLNAVRAGVVDDPKEYRWCGYAEAVAGKTECADIHRIVLAGYGNDQAHNHHLSYEEALEKYRLNLYLKGAGEKGFDRVHEVRQRGGKLSQGELLRCRVKYFSAGAVLGCRAFVDEVIHDQTDYFGGQRKTGAQKMRGGDWGGLCVARQLCVNVIT